MDMEPTFRSTCYLKGKDNFLRSNLKMTFQSLTHVFPFRPGPNPLNQEQRMWSWLSGLEAKSPGSIIVRENGSETKQVIIREMLESLSCAFQCPVPLIESKSWCILSFVMLAEF